MNMEAAVCLAMCHAVFMEIEEADGSQTRRHSFYICIRDQFAR